MTGRQFELGVLVTGWCAVLMCSVAFRAFAQDGSATMTTDEEEVRAVFYQYKEALAGGDGALAASLVDRDTLVYFDQLRELALRASEEEVRQRSFIEKLLILSMRHALDRATIANLDLAALIEVAMSEGWISPETLAHLDIGSVEVAGDQASAEVISGLAPLGVRPAGESDAEEEGSVPAGDSEQDVELRYRFVREDGAWRFRFSSLVSGLDELIAQLTAELGTQQDALIFMLIESFSGQKVLPEVWETPAADDAGAVP